MSENIQLSNELNFRSPKMQDVTFQILDMGATCLSALKLPSMLPALGKS